MRKFSVLFAFAVALIAAPACNPQQKQVARTVLDISSYACVIANAHLDSPAIAKACDVQEAAMPALEELLKQHRMAMAKAGRPMCVEPGK